MSMHDIEAFTEGAVMFVYNASLDYDEKLALIHNIYRFHDMFDTGFTKLNVYDILVKQGYLRLFMPWEDPAAEKYNAILPKVEGKGFEYILENPEEEWSPSNPVVCYWIGEVEGVPVNNFACDTNHPIWKELTNRDIPQDMDALELILTLAEYADEAKDYEMLGDLFYVMLYFLCDLDENDDESLRLRALLQNEAVIAVAARNWGHVFEMVAMEDLEDSQREWLKSIKN